MAKKKKDDRQVVVNSIVMQAPPRRVYDVGDWRSSLRAADTGRVKYLYDLFDDLLIDGVLSDAIDKRVQSVLNAELIFMDARGNKVDRMAELIDTSAWETLLRSIMDRKFFGRAAAELLVEGDGFRVLPIKPKYVDLQQGRILLDDGGMRSVSYVGDPNLLVLGRPDDFGLLLKAAPYAIWKRGGFGDYAQWIELFGMPQRIGKYNTYDPESRMLLEKAFKEAGSAPYVIAPKETDIQMLERNSGSGTSYNDFRQANNEEILITILGQTLTTIQGERGARSLGMVHMEVEESKHTSDLRFVQRVLNEHVLPMLQQRGLSVAGGKFVYPKAAEPLTVDEIVRLSEIIDIPARYIHEKYSIPMAEGGEQIAGRKPQVIEEIETKREPVTEVRHEDDRTFIRRVWDFFVSAPQGGAMSGTIPMRMSDGTLEDRLIARVASSQPAFDTELYTFISDNLLKGLRTGFVERSNADAEVAYGLTDDAMKVAMEINLFQFSAAKTLAELQELNRLLRESGSFEEFERKARETCTTFNREWQRTEYDNAVMTAEMASSYRRLQRQKQIFPYWEYVTARDARVREAHRLLDGVILSCDDELWNKIYPPNGWRCRCIVIGRTRNQVKDVDIHEMRERVNNYFDTKDWKMAVAQGWGVNRALVGEVFTQNQFYIRKFQDKASKMLGDLHYNDWGLDSFGTKLAAAKDEMPIYKGSAEAWYKQNSILEDYKGRKVVIDSKVFTTHTTDKHEIRVDLLKAVPETLKEPDEVWMNDYMGEFKNLNFIRFYNGHVIDVVCEVTENLEYFIKTWFEIPIHPKINRPALKKAQKSPRKKDPRWMYRRGLLIKK